MARVTHNPTASRERGQDRLYEALVLPEEGVGAMVDSDSLARYLRARARFHRYSEHNVALILAQYPAAMRVAGYRCAGRLLYPGPDPGTLGTGLAENRHGWTKRPAQRARRLLSIRALAERAGVSTATIVRIEAGGPPPRFVTMRRIATALGAEPAEISEFAAAIQQAAQGKAAA